MLSVVALMLLLTLGGPGLASADEGNKFLVFAAASTTNAVTDICNLFNAQGKAKAVPSFASSSTLAKQIESGAPAGVFISANVKWMDYLAEKGMIVEGSRIDLLGNRIVLIAPGTGPAAETEIDSSYPLVDQLAGGKLAMGDPDHVPAGIYGKEALESLGFWEKVGPATARSKDVRAALALVERGECPLGVVYATDAAISAKVKVIGLFPESAHKPINYPAALIKESSTDAARDFLAFLQSDEARAIFKKYGFSVR